MTTETFTVISDEAREGRTNKGAPPSAISLALESGVTIFIPGEFNQQVLNQKQSYLTRHGFRAKGFKTIRDGVEGRVMWAEKRVAATATRPVGEGLQGGGE